MNLSQLLGSAGVVGQAWRQEEEAQRVAKQNQMLLDEQTRLEALKANLARADLSGFQPAAVPSFGMQTELPRAPGMAVEQITPAVPAQAAAPVARVSPEAVQGIARKGVTLPAFAARPQIVGEAQAAPVQAPGVMGRARAEGAYYGARQPLRAEVINRFGPQAPGIMDRLLGRPLTPEQQNAQEIMGRIETMTPEELQTVLTTGKAPAATAAAAPTTPPAAGLRPPTAPTQLSNLTQAQIKVESAGKPGAVSPKGAVGLMQVMPQTAMDPGFGLPNVFDFAQQMGAQVGKRNEAEAKRLLADPTVGAAYGQQYMGALLQKYNGNTDYALAAYNAGPARIDKWIASGADPAKLPKETQEYIPKVKAALGLPAPQATAAAGAPPQPLEVPTTQARNLQMAEAYLANPEAIPFELQQLTQSAQQQAALLTRQRNDAAQLAQLYMRSGTAQGIQAAQQLLATVNDSDTKLLALRDQVAQKQTYLQGMQGLRELAVANDPRRLSSVLSLYMGTPVGIQPRSDGTYNFFVNGRKVQEGISAQDLSATALKQFSPEARQAAAASAAMENELALKRKYGDAIVNATRDIHKAMVEGEYKLAEERAKQVQGKLTVDTSKGIAYFQQGNRVLVISPDGKVEEIGGVKVETGPTAKPVVGLNMGR